MSYGDRKLKSTRRSNSHWFDGMSRSSPLTQRQANTIVKELEEQYDYILENSITEEKMYTEKVDIKGKYTVRGYLEFFPNDKRMPMEMGYELATHSGIIIHEEYLDQFSHIDEFKDQETQTRRSLINKVKKDIQKWEQMVK